MICCVIFFPSDGGKSIEEELRDVGESNGVAAGDALRASCWTRWPRKRFTEFGLEKFLIPRRRSAAMISGSGVATLALVRLA